MRRGGRRRGIVGIEAAIVLIAFVIVAAALAFVTLNMGFFTTQKSKEAMSSSLEEASTALEVDGSVYGNVSSQKLASVAIPLKTSSGKNPVDLIKVALSVKTPNNAEVYTMSDIALIVNDNTLYLYNTSSDNWQTFDGTIQVGTNKYNFTISDSPFDTFKNVTGTIQKAIDGGAKGISVPKVLFIEYQGDGDTLLEVNEKWAVVLNTNNLNLVAYTIFTVEIKPPSGAPLTVERMVPAQLSDQVISLD